MYRKSSTTARKSASWAQFFFASVLALGLALACGSVALAADTSAPAAQAGLTLITDTPEAGFALAVKLSQKGVATTQSDASVRKGLRNSYAHNPDSLIAVSQVIAIHFQTVAAANDYWRK
ncbi:MAG: hexameric tyrosine-coordinated heme protein [Castellaniella sp.]